ncbi:MAG: ATP-binding cassette domain-containing protein [Bifidobacteriaceae bacterium]|jgi:ABC-2 type transport system ATP-binding protein|nr:ATP-binding cassette domain-containing protein [Bifidobacteriaceae bacterium]
MNEHAIEIAGAVKTYRKGAPPALNGLDLEVRRGEIFGFLGPNGAGKTTAMRVVMGLAALDAGRVSVLGLAPGSQAALARTGALIETPALYPAASGLGHLRAVARWSGAGPERASEALDLVGLTSAGSKKTKDYSLGMKQRLGVATALLKDPELLVLDEPANGLDPQGMSDMRELLAQLRQAGRTVLLSSHLLGEVERISDRVGVIVDGRMIRTASPRELRDEAITKVLIDARPLDEAARAVRESGLVPPGAIAIGGGGQLDGSFDRPAGANGWSGMEPAALSANSAAGLSSGASAGSGEALHAPAGSRLVVGLGEPGPRGLVGEALVPELVGCLVRGGLMVYGVELDRPDLAEAFLALTRAAGEARADGPPGSPKKQPSRRAERLAGGEATA